eukprot:XP_011683444.1 PREDICTED: uncharacterized protein LOC105447289 [Strongylocentrotus purpuratus]
MMDARRDLCLILLISSYVQYAKPNNLLIDYSSNTKAEVSQGSQAQFECSSSRQIPAASLRTGRIKWSRNTRYSTSTQVIARWTNDGGTEILLDDPDGRYSIEGGLSGAGRFRQYLTIRQVQRIDQTDNTGYYCALFNSSRSLLVKSAYAPLTVKYPPADHYPLCTATPDDISKDVELMCTSEKTTPGVTVQWYKDDVKVSDAHQSGYKTKSLYDARRDELVSEFECRLYYRNGDDVEVRRSCKFSEPRVAIFRMGGDPRTGQNKYHAFTVSNPPLISDINCTLEASSATFQRFDVEFPGYGVVEVGPVAPVDNGSRLVCQARNVFGVGEATMVVYSPSCDQNRETTLPSVVTNYMPVGQDIQATTWPKELERVSSATIKIGRESPCDPKLAFSSSTQVQSHSDVNKYFIVGIVVLVGFGSL